jgi:hypothetical protein
MTKHEWSEPDWRLNVEGMINDEARIAPRFGHWGFVIHSSFVIRHLSFS